MLAGIRGKLQAAWTEKERDASKETTARIAGALDSLGFAGRYTIAADSDASSCRFDIDSKAQCITVHQPFVRQLPNGVFLFPGMIVTLYGNASFRKDDPNMDAIIRFALARFAAGYGRNQMQSREAIARSARRVSAKVDALVRQVCAQGAVVGDDFGVSEADTDQRLREELKAMIDDSEVWDQRRLGRRLAAGGGLTSI